MKSNIKYLIYLLLVINLTVPALVYAGTQNLSVVAEGSEMQTSYVGGAADYTVLNSDDGNTSYMTTAGGSVQTKYCAFEFNFTDAHTSINNVTLYWKARNNNSGYCVTITPYYKRSGVRYYGTSYDECFTSWNLRSYNFGSTCPTTGLPWTESDIDNYEFGLKSYSGSSLAGGRVTYMYLVVDYEAATLPSVSSSAASSVEVTTSTLNGSIDATGGDTPDYYGFVWDTVDEGDPGNIDPSTPAGSWDNGWKSSQASYGVDNYSHGITGLSEGVTYYFRFAAHNSVGWEYSDALSFTTDSDPSIITMPATSVGSTTAQLNAQITDDGGDDCTVSFAWAKTSEGAFADWAAIVAAPSGQSETVAGTFATGEYPSLDIDSLTVSTGYTFMARAVNAAGTVYGSQRTFTTTSGVGTPSNLIAIPDDETASLNWVKGDGSPASLIRYRTGSYPTSTVEGTLGYLGNGNSVQLEDLTPGGTYYVSLWGLDSGVYSDNYTTVMFTTLAYGQGAGDDLGTPESPDMWLADPDTSVSSGWPFLGGIIDAVSTEYGTPAQWIWYLVTIMGSTGLGVIVYNRANYNAPLAVMSAIVVMAIVAVSFKLIFLAIPVLIGLIWLGFAMFGERR